MPVLLAVPPIELEQTLFPASSPRLDSSPRSEDGLYVSQETYRREYYDHPGFNYEWKNRRLEEKAVSQYVTTELYHWFLELLQNFLRVHKIGKIIYLETGFELDLPDGEKVRKPDLGLVLNDNPVPIQVSDRSYQGTFDLCIEAISYSTRKEKACPDEGRKRDTVVKKKEYAEAKVKEFYILDGTGFETAFFRLNQQGKYEKIKPSSGGVIQSEVLPGFQFRLADLYRRPTPKETAFDEVYRGFIMLDYQAEKERADFAMQRAYEEKLRADEEKLKAEEERRRADELRRQLLAERQEKERLAAKLRELGIELD